MGIQNIGWVGLGKLGLTCAMTGEFHGKYDVLGSDPSPSVDEILSKKILPYREVGAEELLQNTHIRNVTVEEVVAHSELVFLAVQTPHEPLYEGTTRIPDSRVDFDYSHLIAACKTVNEAANKLNKITHLVIISTVIPGTIDREIRPLLGGNIKLGYSPLFIAMGTCRQDYENPELVLFGVDDEETYKLAEAYFRPIHNAPVYKCSIKSAELAKVAYNTMISMKLAFVNHLMEVCHHTGADIDQVTDVIKLSKDRLISPKYLTAGMGDGGGCFFPEQIVFTEEGPKEIRHIQPGERVLSSDGKLHTVLETYKRPWKGYLLRFRATGLLDVLATPEHPFMVSKDQRKKYVSGGMVKTVNSKVSDVPASAYITDPSEVQAALLTKDHYAVFPRVTEASIPAPSHATEAYMLLAGYYLSEGCIEKEHKVRCSFYFHQKEQKYMEEVEALARTVDPEAKTRRSKSKTSLGETVVVNSKKIAELLLKDFGSLAWQKKLPSWVLYGDVSVAKNISRGMWRGDGSSNSGGFNFTTTSRDLAYGMYILLNKLAIVSTMKECPPRTGKSDGVYHRRAWEVRVRNACHIDNLSSVTGMPIKHQMQKKRYPYVIPVINDMTHHKIWSITPEFYEGTVWNLNVEGTHKYLTSLGISLNCHPRDNIALSWLAQKIGMTFDFPEAIMMAREKQTEFLANLVEQNIKVAAEIKINGVLLSKKMTIDLPVIILGKAFKEQTNLIVGSPAILLKNILQERGISAEMYDPWVDNALDKTVNPYENSSPSLFFIGTHHAVFADYKFPQGSVVIDPWRMIKDQEGVRVIRVGEASKAKETP